MKGNIIPNHGYVDTSDIGSTDDTALLCNTVYDYGGNWFAPDGTRVGGPGSADVPGFSRNRGLMVVRLLRNAATDPAAEGIYHCSIRDADGNFRTANVGLYNDRNGS